MVICADNNEKALSFFSHKHTAKVVRYRGLEMNHIFRSGVNKLQYTSVQTKAVYR